jgi:hypothetical protein
VTHVIQDAIAVVSFGEPGYLGSQFSEGRKREIAFDGDNDIILFLVVGNFVGHSPPP